MPGLPFRFVHASDFHLERPLCGVLEVPEHLRELFLDAPHQAAERVFDTAVAEKADFLLLAGDVVDFRRAGPRALEFMHRQLCRLHEEEVAVYWCDSGLERLEDWPTSIPLPPSVHIFSAEHVERVTHRRGDTRVAVIAGRGGDSLKHFRGEDFETSEGLYSIALAFGSFEESHLRGSEVDYWALGGKHARRAIRAARPVAHYCGTPQGRQPQEEGPHGCAVVEVDGRGRTLRQTVATDVVRWQNEEIELPDHIDESGLLRLLRDHAHRLAESSGGRQILVRWILVDGDELTDTRTDVLAGKLREGHLAEDLLVALRKEFGGDVPGIWSVSLEAEPPSVLPSGWYEEDTVLGDLLREVQYLQTHENADVAFEGAEAHCKLEPELRDALQVSGPEDRRRLLRHVAALGVDLLRGDRVLSEERNVSSGEFRHGNGAE